MNLLPVPNFRHELLIKADYNGILILKQGRFRERYRGSKKYAVDINGKKVYERSALRKIIHDDPGRWKKDAPGKGGKKEKTITVNQPKDTATYTINKPEIRQRIYAMIESQPRDKRELYFWTVTFPLKTDDGTIYKLFNTWLTRLRKEKLLRDYLWVAERQQNGTLHFHIAIPHKMPVKKANAYMASALVTASKAGEITFSKYQCKRYNGVDIAKNRKEKKVTNFANGKRGQRALTSYITKYITKNNGKFTHLAWHNSRGFSQLFTGVTFTVDEFVNVFKLSGYVRRYSAINNEYFQYHPWTNGPPGSLQGELLKLNSFIQNLN